MVPKMIALGGGICDVRLAHARDFIQYIAIIQGSGGAQLSPVIPAAASDNVVNRGQRELLVVQVTVLHGGLSAEWSF